MQTENWSDILKTALGTLGSRDVRIDMPRVRHYVNTYLVRSLDGHSLQFSMPITVRRDLLSEIPMDPAGADGAVGVILEEIKRQARTARELGPIGGRFTRYPQKYAVHTEPFTLVHSVQAVATALWKPDHGNYADTRGIHLTVPGALPYPGPPDAAAVRAVVEELRAVLDAVGAAVRRVPKDRLERGWIASLDQKGLRLRLPELGLVSFVGDGTLPARQYTEHRCYYRVAGPKEGIHVPFICPSDLAPVEVELSASGETATGLGIRRREVFAVTGSNAEGKSTFLQAVIAGEDDHAIGDGRERVVTVWGLRQACAGCREFRGERIDMFFRTLPPGLQGTPSSVHGQGSGSMVMAEQVQKAVEEKAPLLIIDEDQAATNLLVRSCLQSEDITPLSAILSENRGALGETALLFAACSMDILTAEADRILLLERHAARAVDRSVFRRMVCIHLEQTLERLRETPFRGAAESGQEEERDGGNPLSGLQRSGTLRVQRLSSRE